MTEPRGTSILVCTPSQLTNLTLNNYNSYPYTLATQQFLGLVFDTKLSFLPHIRALKARCMKALDVLKVLSATEWGADSTILLQLYRALVRSKLDYGSIIYGSARKSYVKLLDPVHHQGLRLSLGVFRSSPIQSLYVEAREPSLENRRLKLSLQYTVIH